MVTPNAESALNETAGKLLLEDFGEYSRRAQMMTKVHAMQAPKETTRDENTSVPEPMSKDELPKRELEETEPGSKLSQMRKKLRRL